MFDLRTFCTIAQNTGRHLKSIKETNAKDGEWHGTQLKTVADEIAHTSLVRALSQLAPDVPVISEEDGASHHSVRPARYIIIDPLDGTASYAHGFSGYVCQMALVEDHTPAMGVVYAPETDELFSAERGKGAWQNGTLLKISSSDTCSTLVDNYPEPRGAAARMMSDLSISRYVESGSLGLKICRVADGTADIFYKDITVRDWDIAPADLILREAGGYLGLPDGTEFEYTSSFEKTGILATNSRATFDAALASHRNHYAEEHGH